MIFTKSCSTIAGVLHGCSGRHSLIYSALIIEIGFRLSVDNDLPAGIVADGRKRGLRVELGLAQRLAQPGHEIIVQSFPCRRLPKQAFQQIAQSLEARRRDIISHTGGQSIEPTGFRQLLQHGQHMGKPAAALPYCTKDNAVYSGLATTMLLNCVLMVRVSSLGIPPASSCLEMKSIRVFPFVEFLG